MDQSNASHGDEPWALRLVKEMQGLAAVSAFVTVVVIMITTRVLSGAAQTTMKKGASRQTPNIHPYWVPYFGHAPWLALNAEAFLSSLRNWYPQGVFSLWNSGAVHNVVFKPSYISILLNKPEEIADSTWSSNTTELLAFGLRKEDQKHWQRVKGDDKLDLLNSAENLQHMSEITVKSIKNNIADLVTFNSYPADQMEWERLANASVIDDDGKGVSFVDVSLADLLRNFVAKTANVSYLGTDFVENYPDFWELLWTFDEGFTLFSSSVTAWLPHRLLQNAKSARRKLLYYLAEFHDALNKHFDGEDPGAKWQDLDNVSPLCRLRAEEFRKHKVSLEARASFELSLIWAMNVSNKNLVPWMLFEIYRDPILLEEIREELAPFIEIGQPKNDFGPGIWIPAEIGKLDLDGLLNHCPRTQAACTETVRLYSTPWETRWLHEDVVLHDEDSTDESFLLKKGTVVHMPMGMHQRDPEHFSEPEEWDAERFLKEKVDENGRKSQVAHLGSLQPLGVGAGIRKGSIFAQQEIILYTAIILMFYDMTAVKGREWDIPRLVKKGGTTRQSYNPVRVWIKKRDQPSEEEMKGQEKK